MKLSEKIHKYITKGRNGRSDAANSTPVSLTDDELCRLWSAASNLESDLSSLHSDIKKIANRKIKY